MDARQAVQALRNAGIVSSKIGVLSRDLARSGDGAGIENDPTGTHWEEGSAIGAAAGGAAGLGLGLAVAAGLIPGVGPVLAGGMLVALLASAGTGAVAGTVVGGLIGLGVSEDDADYYHAEIERGRTLVVVQAGTREDEVQTLLARNGGLIRAPELAAV